MSQSIQKQPGGPVWPLGFIQVASNGTPVCIMHNVDANNVNSPATPNPPPAQFPGPGAEYTRTFKGLSVYGFQPGNGNVGMVPNVGNVYLLLAAAGGGAGNRTDAGSIVGIIPPGTNYFYPPPNPGSDRFSPYFLYIDADTNNDGAIIVGLGGA